LERTQRIGHQWPNHRPTYPRHPHRRDLFTAWRDGAVDSGQGFFALSEAEDAEPVGGVRMI
jgi:hypothetical protein